MRTYAVSDNIAKMPTTTGGQISSMEHSDMSLKSQHQHQQSSASTSSGTRARTRARAKPACGMRSRCTRWNTRSASTRKPAVLFIVILGQDQRTRSQKLRWQRCLAQSQIWSYVRAASARRAIKHSIPCRIRLTIYNSLY